MTKNKLYHFDIDYYLRDLTNKTENLTEGKNFSNKVLVFFRVNYGDSSRKHAYIILIPLNPIFI